VRAVQAGTDVVIALGPLDAQAAVIGALVAAARSGEIAAGQIDASVLRILCAKQTYGLGDSRLAPDLIATAVPDHQSLADEIAHAAVTLVRDNAALIPLPPEARRILLLSPVELDHTGGVTLLAEILRADGRQVTELIYDPAIAKDRERVRAAALETASSHDAILFGEWELVKRAANWSDRWQIDLVAALYASGTPLVLISWRDPGALVLVPYVSTCLVAYGPTPAQARAVGGVLVGQIEPTGRLPMSLSQ